MRGWPCLAIAHQDVEGYIAAAGGNVRSWGEAEGADGQTPLDLAKFYLNAHFL